MEMLTKDATEREKKDQKGKGSGDVFWRSVAGVIHSAEAGLRNGPAERHTAKELERKVGKYVTRALGNVQAVGCGCRLADEDAERERMKALKGKEREGGFEKERAYEQHEPILWGNPNWQEEREDETVVWGEPKYRLSIPSSTTGSASTGARLSAIDQERRIGFVVPMMENWPLRV